MLVVERGTGELCPWWSSAFWGKRAGGADFPVGADPGGPASGRRGGRTAKPDPAPLAKAKPTLPCPLLPFAAHHGSWGASRGPVPPTPGILGQGQLQPCSVRIVCAGRVPARHARQVLLGGSARVLTGKACAIFWGQRSGREARGKQSSLGSV